MAATLAGNSLVLIVVGVLVLIPVTGFLVIAGRRWLDGPANTRRESTATFVRGWLGLALVGGLLLFCGASLVLPDGTLRSALFGGLIASTGAASAYYFASTGSDQARKDILNASLPTIPVPDLAGMSVTEAQAAVAQLPLRLQTDPATPVAGATVASTNPAGGTLARNGDIIVAKM